MTTSLNGAGLGLRRALLPDLLTMDDRAVDFLEVAPDNWIGVGGTYGEGLARLAERFPLSCHGLSLSLGGPEPLDTCSCAVSASSSTSTMCRCSANT